MRFKTPKFAESGTRIATILLFLLATLHLTSAFPTESPCKRPELEWNKWLAFAQEHNPGIDFVELEGAQRHNILKKFSCIGATTECPPDRAYVFHCEGRTQVLVVFEKDGCVTFTEELDARAFLEVVGVESVC